MKHLLGGVGVFLGVRPLSRSLLLSLVISSGWSPLSECRPPVLLTFICVGAALLTSCGGSYQPPPPPAQDFAIAISPSSVTQQAGGAASTFTVSVTGQNGFTGPVSISLSGLPVASTTSPASPFAPASGASQPATLSVPASGASRHLTVTASR